MEAALFPDSPTLRRILARHTKDALISLALRWIDFHPVTRIGGNPADEDDDDDYNDSSLDDVDWKAKVRRMSTAQYAKHVKKRYEGMREKAGKKMVVDRILISDWNTGLNSRQIADLDLAYYSQHATLKSWHVFKLDYGDQGNMNKYWMLLPLLVRVVFSLLMVNISINDHVLIGTSSRPRIDPLKIERTFSHHLAPYFKHVGGLAYVYEGEGEGKGPQHRFRNISL